MSRALWSLIGGITLTTILTACSSGNDYPLSDAQPAIPPDAGPDPQSPDLYSPPVGPTPIAAVLGMADSPYSSGNGRISFLDLRKRTFLKNPVFEDWFCSPLLERSNTALYVANGHSCDSLQIFNQDNGEVAEIDLDEGRDSRSLIDPIHLLVSPSGEEIFLLTQFALFVYDPKTKLITQKLDFTTQHSSEESIGTAASRITIFGGLLYIGVSDFPVDVFSFGVPNRSRLLVVNPKEGSKEEAEILENLDLPFLLPVSMKPHEESGRVFLSCAGLTVVDRRLIRTGGLTYLDTETLRVDSGIDDQELGGTPGDLELASEFGFLAIHRPGNTGMDHPFSEVRRFQPYPFRLDPRGPVYRDPGSERVRDMKWRPEIERLLIGRRSSPAAIVFITAEGDRDGEVLIPEYFPAGIE